MAVGGMCVLLTVFEIIIKSSNSYNFEYVIALLWPVPVAAQSKV